MSDASTARDIIWDIQLDDAPPVLCASRILHHALLSLLGNAITYSSEGGTIRIGLTVGGRLRLEVEDFGSGISPDDIPHVFERFYRSDVARSSPGTGLGLAIVKAAVEAHRGEISIESVPGKGTIVRIELPL
jgi:signal transduction histidine kinase